MASIASASSRALLEECLPQSDHFPLEALEVRTRSNTMEIVAVCKDFIVFSRATVTERVGLYEQNTGGAAAVDTIISLTSLNLMATSPSTLFQRNLEAAAAGFDDRSNRADQWDPKTCSWRISL